MSRVVIQGDASGTGDFTIAAPNSNTDRTLTLPDVAGTVLTSGSNADFPAGSVLQVVQTVKSDTFSSNSQTTFVDITGMSVDITPSSVSNKILVTYNLCSSITNGAYAFWCRLVRNSTDIAQGTPSGNRTNATTGGLSSTTHGHYPIYVQNMTFLDSPATTSATTYKLQGRGWNTGPGNFYVNQSAADNDALNFARLVSTITAMEIAG